MSENEQLKNVIKQWGWELMKRLKLPLIEIEFRPGFSNCVYTRHNSLLFGIEFLKKFKDKDNYAEAVPPMKFFDRVYFIVAHETAHYLQEYKHSKWYAKYREEWAENSINLSSHVKQKLERNASKIAGILLREHKNKLELKESRNEN